MSESVTIVGPGRMGIALGMALFRTGTAERITYFGRSYEPPPHPLFDRTDEDTVVEYRMGLLPLLPGTTAVVLAVPDTALAEVAWSLAGAGSPPPGCAALHLSGAISTDPLTPLHGAGYSVGSMHPLQTVADPWHGESRLEGVAFALAGEPVAVRTARRLVDGIGGRPLVIPPTLRPLYHASAVMASNYLVALVAAASRALGEAGVPEEDRLPALLPLVQGTVDNLRHLGIAAALTGPIARGDADTVRLHMARLSGDVRALYCALGQETVRLARAAGLDEERAAEIESLLYTG
jgi:predicted short-subunit dehydrogenase-like oxidoreductase (DUF2520 family)